MYYAMYDPWFWGIFTPLSIYNGMCLLGQGSHHKGFRLHAVFRIEDFLPVSEILHRFHFHSHHHCPFSRHRSQYLISLDMVKSTIT
jgi:hypothetical protein